MRWKTNWLTHAEERKGNAVTSLFGCCRNLAVHLGEEKDEWREARIVLLKSWNEEIQGRGKSQYSWGYNANTAGVYSTCLVFDWSWSSSWQSVVKNP